MPTRESTRRSSHHRKAGSTLIESALILTALAIMLIGIFDVSQFLYTQQALVERVRSAARWGAVNDPTNATAIQNYVLYGQSTAPAGATAAYGLTGSMVAATTTGSGTYDYRLTVTLSGYHYSVLTPFVAGTHTGQPITVSVPIGVVE